MSDEEKKAIDYLKIRLYGNEGCKFIDVAQSDLRIFLNLVENLQKDIENWKKYCDEQENDITLKNNKICDLEFQVEKQSKEIEELKDENKKLRDKAKEVIFEKQELTSALLESTPNDKIKAKIEEIDREIKFEQNEKVIIWLYKQKRVLQSLLEKK